MLSFVVLELVNIFQLMPGSHINIVKIADIGLRKSDYVMDDCSTPKLLCFVPIIGNFTTYENQAMVINQLKED